MKSKQTTFLLVSIGVIALVIGLGFLLNKPAGPSKYDDFAKALKAEGAQFYGAFWCPHCQAQKAEFGTAKKYLPYNECSNPNQTVTSICIEQKIEGYPTWKFKNGITLSSAAEPTICKVSPGDASEPAICLQPGVASKYGKTWMFKEYKFSVHGPTEPVKEGTVWKFPADAWTTGEVPMEFLAKQINYTLPQ